VSRINVGTSSLVGAVTLDSDSDRVSLAVSGNTVTIGAPATPGYDTIKLTDLTASRLVASNADKELVSTDASSWVAGTTNQVNVTDDGDGTATLSTPQDIHTGATPTFAGMTLTGNLLMGANGVGYNAAVLTFASGANGTASFTGNVTLSDAYELQFRDIDIAIWSGTDGVMNFKTDVYHTFSNAIQVTGGVGATSGAGLDLFYNADISNVQSFDHTGATWRQLRLLGDSITFYYQLTEIAEINNGYMILNSTYELQFRDPQLSISSTADGVITYSADGNHQFLYTSGDVGVAISDVALTPAYTLHLHNSGTGASDHSYIHFTTGDTGATATDGLTIGYGANNQGFLANRESTLFNLNSAGGFVFNYGAIEAMRIEGALYVNYGKVDYDFQVRGDNETNLIRTDAANDRVGIATAAPAVTFEVTGTSRMNGTGAWQFNDANKYIQWDATNMVYATDSGVHSFTGGALQTGAGRIVNTTRVTAGPYAVLATDHALFCDTDGGAFEIDLPAGVDGTEYKISNTGTSGNDLTVDPNGTEQINHSGAGTAVTLVDGESLTLVYETTEGWIAF
jgi:hypothetical protein